MSKRSAQRNRHGAAADAYSNPAARLGYGTPNLVEGAEYVSSRISLDYQKLLNLYRGSWIIRNVVDVFAEDMLKDFPELVTQAAPGDLADFAKIVDTTNTEQKLLECLKWGRLFGGSIGVICIKGDKDLKKELKPEDVLPGTYRGILPLDRWSGVNPSSELISDLDNPAEYGLPMYYECTTETGQNFRVHHSRVLRFTGRDLPLYERQLQTYWGMSEVESVFEELKRLDYASSSIASLLSRAQVMVFKEPMLAQALSGVGMTNQQYTDYLLRLKMISDGMSSQGLLALGDNSELQPHQYSFGGVSDVLTIFMVLVAGASGYPFSKLYGRTVNGLAQSNEGDLQLYYDMVEQKRKRELRPQLNKLIPIICQSVWGGIPEDLDYKFPPVRTMSNEEQADLADKASKPILDAYNAGIYGRQTALKELKQLSNATGMWSNISDEMIENADDDTSQGELFGNLLPESKEKS